jgi:NAD(P)-dependent dehydrogenase (short-subunit alcohol dehydrogenase family)
MKLENRVALVTGGNSGIGRGIALRCAAEGARVAITGRDPAKGARVLAELRAGGSDADFIPADLSDERQAAGLVAAVAKRFGGIDVVVNNAGLGTRRSSVQPDDGPGERLRKIMEPNLQAAYFVASHALPQLQFRGGGAIVNISSTAAVHGTWGNYGIAKAAVEALTRSLAVQGAPHRIRANGISPGWISTEVAVGHAEVDRVASLFARMGTPDEIARVAVFLASDDASFVTGQTLIVDGGLTITDYPSEPWLNAVGAWRLFPHSRPAT